MAERKVDDEQILEAYRRFKGASSLAAKHLGIDERTFQNRRTKLGLEPRTKRLTAVEARELEDKLTASFDIPTLPDDTAPIDELIAHRKKVTARKIAAYKARELIQVPVLSDGPIALAIIGDPHVDDDGCDWDRLHADLKLIQRTPNMHAVHVGDITNNWFGRLFHLWAQQSTTGKEALRLAEYVLTNPMPLIVVGGNHDGWPGPASGVIGDVLRNAPTLTGDAGVRVAFEFPNGFQLRMHVRHDFPGRSMYATTHGMRRELREGYRDHLLIAGHLHTDEVQITPVETDGLVSLMARVSGYKIADKYAADNRFVSKRMAPSLFVVVDPDAPCPAEVMKPFWDGERAARYLALLRRA